jgi:phage I-like protein
MSDKFLITSAYSVPLNGEAPSQIMFFPEGKHTIKASVNGAPKKLSVTVTKETASVMQASLTELLKEPVEPFIDYDHKSEAAAAIPKAFTWKDGEGVMLDLEWTTGGASAVQGKAYRYFSPTFHVNDDGIPCSLPDSGPVGSLVNNPAFRRMKSLQTISASDEGAQTGDDEPPTTHRKKQMADETAQETVTAALRSEVETLRAENKKLVESIEQQRVESVNREADLLIDGAVKAHKLAPKDAKAIAGLKKFYLVDAEAAREYVESLPVNPAFKQVINAKVGDRDTGKAPGASRADEMRSIVKKIQASHPGMSFQDAWDIAEADHPDKFGTSRVVEA